MWRPPQISPREIAASSRDTPHKSTAVEVDFHGAEVDFQAADPLSARAGTPSVHGKLSPMGSARTWFEGLGFRV